MVSGGFDGDTSDPRFQNCHQRRPRLSGGPLATKRPAASWSSAVAATSSTGESSMVCVSPGSYRCLSAMAAVRLAISCSTLTQRRWCGGGFPCVQVPERHRAGHDVGPRSGVGECECSFEVTDRRHLTEISERRDTLIRQFQKGPHQPLPPLALESKVGQFKVGGYQARVADRLRQRLLRWSRSVAPGVPLRLRRRVSTRARWLLRLLRCGGAARQIGHALHDYVAGEKCATSLSA
jgi:hypothetical protein